ncbi:GNAT family N-acetyltransferase [Chloroflexia bacterium SDU3-3]|nr:GNAT family N-acetyltransferase [Chloroflexia bacterium SDU3-3]
MNLTYTWSRLPDLTALELHEIIKAREAVFVVEQQCPYQETDDMDLHAWHLRVALDGALAAYIRVVDPGIKYEQPSIGRVLTLPAFRRLKIGRALLGEGLRFTEQQFPDMGIKIGAQVYLREFYESFGFQSVSEVYVEDGIPHIDMVRPSQSDQA